MFRQYIPGFVDSEPQISEANSLEEILAIDWVAKWATKPNFQKWAGDRSLIAFFDNGNMWYIIGTADFDLNLPKPVYPKIEVVEPHYTGGIQIKQDGNFWMIWRPSEDGRAMLGYCGDSDTWRYGMAQRYPSRQACEEIINAFGERSEHVDK